MLGERERASECTINKDFVKLWISFFSGYAIHKYLNSLESILVGLSSLVTVMNCGFVASTIVTCVTSSVRMLIILRRFTIFLRSSRSRVPHAFISVRDTKLVRTLLAVIVRSPRGLFDDWFLRVRVLLDVLISFLLSHRPRCVDVVGGYLFELR